MATPYKDTFLYRNFGLCEPAEPDPDGTYAGYICPPDQATACWYMSWIILITIGTALYYRYYDFAILTTLVLITSLLYWSSPTYSWRRNLDIIVVQIALWWHMYRAIGAANMIPYFTLVGVGVLAFIGGWLFFNVGSTWAGTLSHMVLHIAFNAAHVILYMGEVGTPTILAKAAALFAI